MFIPTIITGKEAPKHFAISLGDTMALTHWNKKEGDDTSPAILNCLMDLIDMQVKREIPVLSIKLDAKSEKEQKHLRDSLKALTKSSLINDNKIRIFCIGDWYGLDTELVNQINESTYATKEYDSFFVNLCISYDGRKEILAALRLLVKKASIDRINSDALSEESIKENIPSSYFIPPELIIILGDKYDGFLLWDSPGSTILQINNRQSNYDLPDVKKALDSFSEQKRKAD